MKKLLGIVVLGLINFISVSANEIYDSSIYLKCELHPGVTQNYVLIPEVKVVMIYNSSSADEIDRILLGVTPDAYNFEYLPINGKPVKFIISIDRFTGKLTQTIEAGPEENKATSVLYGNCNKIKF